MTQWWLSGGSVVVGVGGMRMGLLEVSNVLCKGC